MSFILIALLVALRGGGLRVLSRCEAARDPLGIYAADVGTYFGGDGRNGGFDNARTQSAPEQELCATWKRRGFVREGRWQLSYS